MKILVNHLTRMHRGNICVAGVDSKTHRHVRPVVPYQSLPAGLLARHGGPFDMGRLVDLGSARARPKPPHVEDHEFGPWDAKSAGEVTAEEFWNLLHLMSETDLAEIFGDGFRQVSPGRLGTDPDRGEASLGCLRPEGRPRLYLQRVRDGKPRIRIEFDDGRLQGDAGVTDLRLFGTDHATPDEDRVRGVAKWIQDSREVILGVGLTRKYRASDDAPYFHWLQVNNIHLSEDPLWQLA